MTREDFVRTILGYFQVVPSWWMTPAQWMQVLKRILDRIENLLAEIPRAEDRQAVMNLFTCLRAELEGQHPSLSVAYADNIESIEPVQGCAGAKMIIKGHGFGIPGLEVPIEEARYRSQWAQHHLPFDFPVAPAVATHPDNTVLLLPALRHFRVAEVPTGGWRDTEIRLPIPAWARRGCIGLLNWHVQQQWIDYTNRANYLLQEGLEALYVACGDVDISAQHQLAFRQGLESINLTPPIDAPPCTGRNFFEGTIPEIVSLGVNGRRHLGILPGESVVVTWQVLNAQSVRLERFVPGWPPATPPIHQVLYEGADTTGALQYTPPSDTAYDHQLVLIASNCCGPVEESVFIHVRMPSVVTIKGIEVVQVIQEYDFSNPDRQNIVPLFKGKRTMLRVYLDSGLPASFNQGTLSHVTGQLKVGDRWIRPVQETGAYPFDPNTSRLYLSHSLNFILEPEDTRCNQMSLKVRVFSADPYARWAPVEGSVSITLQLPTKLDLYVFYVRDKFGNETTDEEVDASLDRLRTIFPISWQYGLNVKDYYLLETDLDFKDEDDWYSVNWSTTDLFDLVEEAAQEIDDDDPEVIYCAIVPRAACDTSHGRGWPGGLDWLGGTSERICYWRASATSEEDYIEAHETGHALNLNENDGGISIYGVDLRDPLNPKMISSSAQIMQAGADHRWVNPGEYLWVYKRDPIWVVQKCLELGLPCDLAVFYV